jgi:hypothetical protein
MKFARKLVPQKALMAIALLTVASSTNVKRVEAAVGSPQTCVVGETCVLGEYLYDDEYTPITTADICDLDVRYPDGSSYLADQNMTPASESDGWYSYSFTTPSITGYYRANVCCVVDGQEQCLDKSFESVTSSSSTDPDTIASAVWGYSNRTLSSFGDLITDIWGYSSRTLSSFGSLVSDIWNHSTTTSTSTSTSTANNTVINQINQSKTTSDENRLLLEQLVNKPIITNVWEEDDDNLGSKLQETKAVANQLFVNNQFILAKVGSTIKNWTSTTDNSKLDTIIELNELIGEESDSSNTTIVFGSIAWLKSSWDWFEIEEIAKITKDVKSGLNTSQAYLASSKSLPNAKSELQSVVASLIRLDNIIGTATDISTTKTLYGKISQTDELAAQFISKQEEVENLLSNWETVKSKPDTKTNINDLKRQIIAINKVPKGSDVLRIQSNSDSQEKSDKNTLYSMRGLLVSNKLLLSKGAGAYLTNSWLEEGSMVIKTLVINPSKIISQEAEVKYYLPPEVEEADVISHDEPLAVKYDIEKDQYYIEGKVALAINDSKSFSVKLTDIWVISQEDINSLRQQAQDLVKPLEETSYFAQGVTLKSDIDSSLNKITSLQKGVVTPEQKIRAYREAMIEKDAVDEKLSKLQDLVTLAGSTSTLFGFVGSTQALAVWGLIIVMISGFVFLVIYMKKMHASDEKNVKKDKKQDKKPHPPGLVPAWDLRRLIKFASSFLIFGALTATVSGLIVAKIVTKSVQEKLTNEQETQKETAEEEKEALPEEQASNEEAQGGQNVVLIQVPVGNAINVRSGPSENDSIVGKIKTSLEAIKTGEKNDWTNIVINDNNLSGSITKLQGGDFESDDASVLLSGWVHTDFILDPAEDVAGLSIEQEPSPSESSQKYIVILDTPTGWLRIRNEPEGEEIGKALPGEKYLLIGQTGSWYQIELEESTLGWIHTSYAKEE